MTIEIFVFLLTLISTLSFTWFVLLRRTTNIRVSHLFEPATFNLLILSATGTVGALTIFVLHKDQYFNKVVNQYATSQNSTTILLLCATTLISLSAVSKFNRKRIIHHTVNSTQLNHIDRLFILLTIAVLTSEITTKIHFFTNALSASNQFEVLQLRKESTTASSLYFLKRLFLDTILWILMIHFNTKKHDKKGLILILAVNLLYPLYFLTSLKKIQFILYLISIWAARNYNSRISLIRLAKQSALIIALLFLSYTAFVKKTDIQYMLSPFREGLIGRIFISEISSAYAHFEIFSHPSTKLGTSSLSSSISRTLDIPHSKRSGEIVMETVNPKWVEAGIGGTYNTAFFGEAFANFGIYGAFLSILHVCAFYLVLTSITTTFLSRFRKALLIFFSINISVMSGYNDFIYNPFLLTALCILLLASATRSSLSKRAA